MNLILQVISVAQGLGEKGEFFYSFHCLDIQIFCVLWRYKIGLQGPLQDTNHLELLFICVGQYPFEAQAINFYTY